MRSQDPQDPRLPGFRGVPPEMGERGTKGERITLLELQLLPFDGDVEFALQNSDELPIDGEPVRFGVASAAGLDDRFDNLHASLARRRQDRICDFVAEEARGFTGIRPDQVNGRRLEEGRERKIQRITDGGE